MAESAGRPPEPGWASDSRGVESPGAPGAVVAALCGSAADGPVVDWAVDSAARLGSPLRLVTVVDSDSGRTRSGVLRRGTGVDEGFSVDPVHQVLDRALERARSRRGVIDIDTAASLGSPASVLVQLSESASLLVVGAPARGRLGRTLLGSVAFPLVAGACCPVVVVPADTVITSPRHLIVGVDGSEGSLRAVDMALRIAKGARGARVTCVLGWNLEGVGGAVITEPSEPWTAVERRLALLGHQKVAPVAARYPGIRVDIVTRYGSPARAVMEAAAELDVDLVVVGNRGRSGLRGLVLGSVSRQVVERAQHVVIVVH